MILFHMGPQGLGQEGCLCWGHSRDAFESTQVQLFRGFCSRGPVATIVPNCATEGAMCNDRSTRTMDPTRKLHKSVNPSNIGHLAGLDT